MRFEYTDSNRQHLNDIALKVREVTSQHTALLHEANLRNYVDLDGINAGLWMYMSYFNLIDQYIQKGRRINHIMDFGCGIGLGWLVWEAKWKDIYPNIKLTNMKRMIIYENKYDLLLNELEIPHSYYQGNILAPDEDPIMFLDVDDQNPDLRIHKETVRADCIIASRVSFEPHTRWSDALGHMVSKSGFLLKEREGPQSRPHKWNIIHVPIKYKKIELLFVDNEVEFESNRLHQNLVAGIMDTSVAPNQPG